MKWCVVLREEQFLEELFPHRWPAVLRRHRFEPEALGLDLALTNLKASSLHLSGCYTHHSVKWLTVTCKDTGFKYQPQGTISKKLLLV